MKIFWRALKMRNTEYSFLYSCVQSRRLCIKISALSGWIYYDDCWTHLSARSSKRPGGKGLSSMGEFTFLTHVKFSAICVHPNIPNDTLKPDFDSTCIEIIPSAHKPDSSLLLSLYLLHLMHCIKLALV